MRRLLGVAIAMGVGSLAVASAGAAEISLTKTSPDYRQQIRFFNGTPSAGTANFKSSWSVSRDEAGSGLLCFAVSSDTGTPKILNSRPEQGTPNGADGELKWSMRCSSDFESAGGLYDVSVETTTPGPMEVDAYLLRGDKLTSGTDAATFASAVIKSTTTFANFRSVCSISRYNNPPQCNDHELIGRFEFTVDADPLIGPFDNPLYVSTRSNGIGIFKLKSALSTSTSVKRADGFVKLTHLFFPTDNQDLLLSVSGGSGTGYDVGKKSKALELVISVMETNIPGCKPGDRGFLNLVDSVKHPDEVAFEICNTRRLYFNDPSKNNNVSVTIGKPKK